MKESKHMMIKMTKSYNNLLEEFADDSCRTCQSARTGSSITVDYYGTPTPLQQVGNVTVPEPRMIQIQPWEASHDQRDLRKRSMTSDIGINPSIPTEK